MEAPLQQRVAANCQAVSELVELLDELDALRDVPGESRASWLDEVRTAARARPLEANLQQVQAGRYNGSVVLSLSTAQAPR